MAGNEQGDKAAWVARVLDVAVSTSQPGGSATRQEDSLTLSQQRGAEALRVARGSVGRAKLQLAIRQAHAEAVNNLKVLCAKVLALPAVKAQNRTADVEKAVQYLTRLIPPLDTALSEALARYDAAEDETARSTVGRDAATLLAGLQEKLAGSRALRELEQFASADMGGMKLAQGLSGALEKATADIRGG